MSSRKLVPRPEYTCEEVDLAKGEYVVRKRTPEKDEDKNYTGDFVDEDPYTVVADKYCTCYAGLMGKRCRHIEIVDIFLAHPEKIGGIAAYCWDRKSWSQ